MPAAAAMDDALTAANYRHDTAQSLRLGAPATKEPVAQDRDDGVMITCTQRL